jgi:dTDP-4-dehydrorhamnose 3,5-epimerase
MKFQPTELSGVYIVEPDIYRDGRGYFFEAYRELYLRELDIDVKFIQDNFSVSTKNVIRGLHYQKGDAAQYKLIMVCSGEILDVVVDIRRTSETFGRHVSVRLSEREHKMILVPAGFAHGFSVLSDEAAVYYKCSSYYNPDMEGGIQWNDPDLGIEWGVTDPIVSEKDRSQPLLSELTMKDLF